MKNVIVTGGAGYIGSHVCKSLASRGFNPITIDNLSRGSLQFVKWGPFYKADLRNKDEILKIFQETVPVGVIHLASFAYVEESIQKPLLYYDNNIVGGINLISAMIECKIKIFLKLLLLLKFCNRKFKRKFE